MKITIRGKVWRFLRARVGPNLRGLCDHHEDPKRTIRVSPSLKGEEELEVTIHEMTHAAFWDLDETVVEGVAQDFAAALWKMGYRKP